MNSPHSTPQVTASNEKVHLVHGHTSLAFSPDDKLGYVGRSYDLLTVDLETGQTLHKYDAYSFNGPVVSPDGRFVYADPGRYIKVIDTQTHQVENGYIFDTSVSAIGSMVASPDGHQLYVIKLDSSSDETLSIISSALPQTLIKDIDIGKNPTSLVSHPHKPVLYVSCARVGNDGGVYAVDLMTDAVTRIPVSAAWSLAISPSGDYLYAGQSDSNSIVIIDTINNGIKATFNINTAPHKLAVSLDGHWLYVLKLHTPDIEVYDIAQMKFDRVINTSENDLRSIQVNKNTGDLWATYQKK